MQGKTIHVMLPLASFLLMLALAPAAKAQTQYDTSPGGQTGVQNYGSYFGAEFDRIGLYNGNVMLNLGLFNLPGRELSMGLSLSYNSQKWEQKICSDGSGGTYVCGSIYTGGWRIVEALGSLSTYPEVLAVDGCYQNEWGNWFCSYLLQFNAYWIDPAGTKHRYMLTDWDGEWQGYWNGSYNGRTLETIDGDRSKIVFDYNWSTNGRATLYLANGSTLYFDNQLPNKLTTANGNYLINSTNGSKLPAQDTLGRTVTYTAGTIGSTADKYRIKDSSNTDRDYEILYKTHSAWNPFASANQTEGSNRTVIDTITLPNGKTWAFEYSHDQRFITKVTMPTGAYVKYEYYGGNTSHNAADDYITARKVSATGNSADEKTWSYSRSESGGVRTITVTSPEGDQVVHTFNDKGEETATAWKNSAGTTLKSQSTTWTQGTAQSNGQPTNPKITTIVTTLDGGLSATETRTLSNGLVTETTQTGYGTSTIVAKKTMTYTTINATVPRDVISTETVYGIDPAGSSLVVQGKTEYFYDQFTLTDRGTSVPNHNFNTSQSNRGNLTKVRAYKDASNYLETQTKYDNLGNVIETIDPLSHSTTVDYTDNFTDSTNRYSFAYPKSVTNALSQSTTSKYDFNTGLVKEILNLRGNATTTAYDLLNRITSVTEPAVGGVSKVTTYAYDDTNRKTTKEVTVDTSGNKGHVETFFDKLYRTVKVVTNDPEGAITVETEYDANGRSKKTSNPYRSGDTVVWSQTAYDGLSRPVTVTAPDSSAVGYSYANNITTTTDQAGNQRRYTYNVLGQLTTVEEPNPTLDTPAVTTYTYYGFGPLYQSNQSNQTRTWVYNWLGQMTSQTLPESGTTTFTYNGAGMLVTKTDARNIVTTMTYDNANRLTQRSYSDSTPTVSFTYDQNGYTGQRTTMTDGLGSVTYAFDARDRLTQESRTLTGITGTFSTSYVYNVKGDVTQMTYPSGRVVNFVYATGGGCCNSRLSSVSDGTTSTTLVNGITFNAAGGVLTQAINPGSNAINQTFTYNNRLQLTQIQATQGSTTLMDFTYNYGTSTTNTGRVLSRTDAIQLEHSANYVYDSIYRLSQAAAADASWGIAWTLDTWGNRLTQTPAGLATSKVGSPSIAYTSNRNQAHSYDGSGNTTNDTVHNYAFNAENQQTSMDGGAATYAYDGEGRRMKKVTSSETTYMFYGPGGILCEFSTTTGLTSATTAASTDRTLYRASERTGTAVLLFNTSGAVLENNRTLPYGEAWLSDVASLNDKKFTTYDRDKESGLDYAMARMYANTSGRFTSPDKGPNVLNEPSTLNRYVYVKSDPVNLADPDGDIGSTVGGGEPERTPRPIPGYCAPEFARCGVSEGGTTVRAPSTVEKTMQQREIMWDQFMKRVDGLKDSLTSKLYGEDCNRTLGKLSGATMANGQRAGTVNIEVVLAALNRAEISDGREAAYFTLFSDEKDRNQARNTVSTRNWTVADAMGIRGNPAMAQEGGTAMYFNEVFNRRRSDDDLSATLLHEATHNLGFSETGLTSLGVSYNQILQDCIKQ